MSQKIGEIANVCDALAAVNINVNYTNTSGLSMANFDRIMFVVTAGMSNAAGSLYTIEAMQGTSTAASTAISMNATVTNVSLTANKSSKAIEWRATDMNTADGYIYAFARVHETNTRISTVSAIAIRTPARYKQATQLG